MKTANVTKLIKKVKKLLELEGENKFKLRTYDLLIEELNKENIEIAIFIQQLEKTPIQGLGNQTIKDLKEIQNTGSIKIYEDLKKLYPDSIFELFEIRGLGATKIKNLFDSLKIDSINSLKKSINDKTIFDLKGYGEKSVKSVEENIVFIEKWRGYFRLDTHEEYLNNLTDIFSHKVVPFGLSADKEEVFNKIELQSNINDKEEILSKINTFYKISPVENNNLTFNFNDIKCEISFVPEPKINEKKQIKNLLKGIIHTHTTYSDGANSIEEMANYCIQNGYEYLGVTDHSKTAAYAGGLSEDKLKLQITEINELNEKLKPFKILKGIESDILADGSLDYSDKILESLDFVIASVHSGFNINKNQMTDRIISAIKNPHTKILGHPTGRLLLSRPEYEIDLDQVIKTCIEYDKIIELNSNPKRLDLSWKWIEKYKDSGLKIIVTPDAHSLNQIDYVKYGQLLINKVQFDDKKVINYLNLNDFIKEINK